jgi:SAM-dependent methyltransferase
MSLLERLFAIAPIRKTLWRLWYPFLTRRLRTHDVLFLNYAFQTDPPIGLDLTSADEPHRASIQLYHHVASQIDLTGLQMLEVSCGHGGGAAWITRHLHPAHFTGLDLNPLGIRFCQQRHPLPNLNFIQGDAQSLPFADASLDAVLNLEASHCYPDFPGFLANVHRVLRPGGHLLYADFRFAEDLAPWQHALSSSPLTLIHQRDISPDVLRGMDMNAQRSRELVRTCLPSFLHGLGSDFAAVPGSRVYDALKNQQLSYHSALLKKETQPAS